MRFTLSILSIATLVNLASGNYNVNEDFAFAVNGELLCDEVVLHAGLYIDENGNVKHEKSFACRVNPAFTPSGSSYVELTMLNLHSSFEEQKREAESMGKTSLCINGSSIEKSVVVIPANDGLEPHQCAVKAFGSEEEQCFAPVLNWKVPDNDTVSRRQKNRSLAVNQTGLKSIVVFRVTTSENGSPTASAASVSDNVFGPSDQVNIASQYEACSNGALDFTASTVAGLSFSAAGVVDISLTTTSSTLSGDIVNLVRTQVGDTILNQIDHYFVQVVSFNSYSTWLDARSGHTNLLTVLSYL